MSDLRMNIFGGEDNYSGVFATNITKEQAEKQPEYAGFYNATAPTDQRSGSFSVAAGTSFVMGGIGNWENGEVPNASLSVTSPSGIVIDTATAPSAAGQVVLLPTETQPSGSVYAFLIADPEPGMWSVTIGDESDAGDFQVTVTNIPALGATDMVQVFESMVKQNQESLAGGEGLAASAAAASSWGCISCKCVTYPLALIIAAALAADTSLIVAGSAIVNAVIAAAGGIGLTVSVPATIAFLTGLAAAEALTVGFILTSLCSWLGICED